MALTFIFYTAVITFLLYSLYIFYCKSCWEKIPEFKPGVLPAFPYISIIIPARNEEKNIGLLLQSIARQSYPKEFFEVIVIDDHSTDNTAKIAKDFGSVKLIDLEEELKGQTINSYKKKAIECGIKKSGGKLIVCTDADCTVPPDWLQTMASFYLQTNASFIVMPVRMKARHRFIEIFQALDFSSLQGITGAAVHDKMMSMCNGANLAYSKAAFESVNGFEGINHIASGDDMLLMHKIVKQDPSSVHYLKSPDVIVSTAAAETVGQFLQQRIRWASKAGSYDDKNIYPVLLLIFVLNVCLLIVPVWSIMNGNWFMLLAWFFLLVSKTVVEMLFLFPVMEFFKSERLMWWFPVMQPFHIVYTVTAGLLGRFHTYKWKDRSVR